MSEKGKQDSFRTKNPKDEAEEVKEDIAMRTMINDWGASASERRSHAGQYR